MFTVDAQQKTGCQSVSTNSFWFNYGCLLYCLVWLPKMYLVLKVILHVLSIFSRMWTCKGTLTRFILNTCASFSCAVSVTGVIRPTVHWCPLLWTPSTVMSLACRVNCTTALCWLRRLHFWGCASYWAECMHCWLDWWSWGGWARPDCRASSICKRRWYARGFGVIWAWQGVSVRVYVRTSIINACMFKFRMVSWEVPLRNICVGIIWVLEKVVLEWRFMQFCWGANIWFHCGRQVHRHKSRVVAVHSSSNIWFCSVMHWYFFWWAGAIQTKVVFLFACLLSFTLLFVPGPRFFFWSALFLRIFCWVHILENIVFSDVCQTNCCRVGLANIWSMKINVYVQEGAMKKTL